MFLYWPLKQITLSGLGWLPTFTMPIAKPVEASTRYYRQSLDKLNNAIDIFNAENLDFVIELGDFKDQDTTPVKANTLKYLRETEAVFTRFNGARYHVLGNHDMDSLSKKEFLENIENNGISKNKSYYSFDQNNFHFIVLDGNYTSDGKDYNNGNFNWTDCNINPGQLLWLKKDLKQSGKPTIIFIHQRLDTTFTKDKNHCIRNSKEVRTIIENAGNVLAVFQGHDHKGGFSEINGIHYYTQISLVDGKYPENNSFSIVEIQNGTIKIDGYKNAKSHQF